MKIYRKSPMRPKGPASSWSIHTRKGSASQQKAREKSGRPNREQAQINAEIAGDHDFPRSPDRGPDVDKARINAEHKRHIKAQLFDDIRARFGPRLIRPDGSALYLIQLKRKAS
jgi:hypothetical protein